MFVWGIDNMLIHFIRYHIAIISDNYISNLFKFLSSEDLTAWIGRVAQHQSLGSLPEGIFNQVRIK